MTAPRPLFQSDFEEERFTCNGDGQIEASVATDATLSGTGSTANPLSVVGFAGSLLCLTPLTDYPVPTVDKRCVFVLEGHISDPDGLYIYNGNSWQTIVTW